VLSGSKQKEVFLSLMTDEKFISNLKKQYKYLGDFGDIKSLEGFLYPDTYFFRPDDLKSLLFPQLLIKTSLKKF
jgi:cell division protein YceG involved in septum cleavage